MASIVESLIGACYLQFGLERTAEALLAAFAPQVDLASGTLLDFKSALQEQLARQGRRVVYEVTEESGPPHDKIFRVQATGRGRGSRRRKRVEQEGRGAGGGGRGAGGTHVLSRHFAGRRNPVRSRHHASRSEGWRECI